MAGAVCDSVQSLPYHVGEPSGPGDRPRPGGLPEGRGREWVSPSSHPDAYPIACRSEDETLISPIIHFKNTFTFFAVAILRNNIQ